MDLSLQGLTASANGMNGSVMITGTSVYNSPAGKPWITFSTINANSMISGITAPSVSGVNYLNGLALIHPYKFYGAFSQIQLASGAVQAFY